MKWLALVAGLFLAGSARADLKRFEVLDNTESPSRQYGMAWGIRGLPGVDFNRIRRGDYDYFDEVTAGTDRKAEDYIVDLRTNTILRTLRGCEYHPLLSHVSLTVAWDPAERYAVVIQNGKYETTTVLLVALPASGIASQVDMYPAMNRTLLRYLDRTGGPRYQKLRDRTHTSMETYALSSAGQICFRLDAVAPQDDLPTVFQGAVIYSLDLAGGRIAATAGDIHDLRDGKQSLDCVYSGVLGRSMKVEMNVTEMPVVRANDDDRFCDRMAYHGTYAYLTDRHKLRLRGSGPATPAGGGEHDVQLTEYERGQNTGAFSGLYSTNGMISGTWTSANGKHSYPFRLIPQTVRWSR